MPNKLTEKLAQSKARIKEKAKKFKPKLVISKLRDGGRVGARRSAWSILGILLYAYFGWWVLNSMCLSSGYYLKSIFRSVIEILLLYILLVCKLFVALPFIFKYTPWIQKNMVFLPYVRYLCNCDRMCWWHDDDEGRWIFHTHNSYCMNRPLPTPHSNTVVDW